MAAGPPDGNWRFLFREEAGIIGTRAWWRGALALAAPMVAMTAIWFALLPFANRDLDERAFIDPMTIVVYVYLLVYAAAILLAAVCFYFLSAKRWRDLGRPPALAGLPLFLAFATGGLHWLQPRVAELTPRALVVAADVVLVAVIAWCVWELGFRPGRAR